jgi:hypothetical protein
MDSFDKRPRLKKMNMRFGACTVGRLYRAASLMTVTKELSNYKLDLVGVQEGRWEGADTEPVGECIFIHGK